jgi:LCP family protein required for cell wall assembly
MKKYMNHMGLLGGITLIILAMSFIGVLGMKGNEVASGDDITIGTTTEEQNKTNENGEEDQEVEEKVPETINGLLIGFDKSGGLTDVIMVGHIDPVTNTVQIISVPRDLEIYFTDEAFKDIKEGNPKNHISHTKLNNIYSLIGWDDRALEDVKSVVEVITGLKMDYMMTIDISGFSDVVDAVGGVEFDVPQDMKYSDSAQDLYIDLDAGLQTLDGDKAEQLIRYRHGYKMGDLQRIKVQQDFVAAMLDQVLHSGNFNQISRLLYKGYNMVEADFGLVVMLDYVEFFFNLDKDHILSSENMITIPSYGEKIDGMWYQYFKLEEAHKAVDTLLFPTLGEETSPEVEAVDATQN